MKVYFLRVKTFPAGLRFNTDLCHIKIGQAEDSDVRLNAWKRVFDRHGYGFEQLGFVDAKSDREIHDLLKKNLYLQCHMPTSKVCVNIKHYSVTKEVFQIESGELKCLLERSGYQWVDGP
ncbi:hypothetical protein [Niveibacterium sp. SC-1]|uniref:hypothetical protein n=1 Tax=Niveibacterium sp. SC-1 TaxID=3135646 RepID=UPI00312048D2